MQIERNTGKGWGGGGDDWSWGGGDDWSWGDGAGGDGYRSTGEGLGDGEGYGAGWGNGKGNG